MSLLQFLSRTCLGRSGEILYMLMWLYRWWGCFRMEIEPRYALAADSNDVGDVMSDTYLIQLWSHRWLEVVVFFWLPRLRDTSEVAPFQKDTVGLKCSDPRWPQTTHFPGRTPDYFVICWNSLMRVNPILKADPGASPQYLMTYNSRTFISKLHNFWA